MITGSAVDRQRSVTFLAARAATMPMQFYISFIIKTRNNLPDRRSNRRRPGAARRPRQVLLPVQRANAAPAAAAGDCASEMIVGCIKVKINCRRAAPPRAHGSRPE